ncbi:ribosome biogenesis GTPase Der [Rickettsiales bacterium LUAb2]
MPFTLIFIGKPNVGKSTLFNLIARKKLAIVEDIAGVTVDLKEATTKLFDINLKIIDSGGFAVDKYDRSDKSVINNKIWEKAEKALKTANVVALVIDAKTGISSVDLELAQNVRKLNPNIIIIVNKIDTNKNSDNSLLAAELGFKDIVNMSAAHSNGLDELYDTLLPYYEQYKQDFEIIDNDSSDSNNPDISIGVVGKPNVGKSTLINKLINEDRLVTSDIPGTTRDSISLYLNYKNKLLRIIDTAGLRKKSKIQDTLEVLSKNDTIRTIVFSQVVVLLISAENGLTKQDLALASYIINEGRALIIAINKIDLITNKKEFINEIKLTLKTSFSDIKGIEIIGISAINSTNIKQIFEKVVIVFDKWNTKIKTSYLNKWLAEETAKNPPPLNKGRTVKIKLMTQTKTRPPTFNLWVNTKDGLPASYVRFLQNRLYQTFNLYGIPLRLIVKKPNNPYNN